MYGTISSSVVAVTALTGYSSSLVGRAVRATITARTGGVMFTYDGTTPTATKGHILEANKNVVVAGSDNISRLKFLREASTDAELTVTIEE